MTASRTLLTGLVDYAGLFPPAALSMADAVSHFGSYRRGAEAWLLGRFVLPASRLGEFRACRTGRATVEPWPLTVLVGQHAAADFRAIARFNDTTRSAEQPGVIVACDLKPDTPAAIRQARAQAPAGMALAFEIAPDPVTLADLLPAVRDVGGLAKLRTGGLVPTAIPSPEALARFIWACVQTKVPFKATAGLHRALRGSRPLTYADDSPVAVLHGFLNVFFAAGVARALHRAGTSSTEAIPAIQDVLSRETLGPFTLTDAFVRGNGNTWDVADLADLRASVALSFGSCSFDEPVADLRALGFVPPEPN